MKLGLIGNCSYQALIDDRARVRWLCWPRFDSSFVFGSLIAGQAGGEMSVEPAGEQLASRQRYRRNTNVLETVFTGEGGSFEVLDFAPRFRLHERYFKPTMLVRIIRPRSGQPRVRIRCRPVYDYGRLTPRSFIASNHIEWELARGALRLTTNAALAHIDEGRPFVLDRPAYVALTWGEPLEAPLAESCESLLARTCRYWERWVKHTTLPGCLQREVIRSALALKLHQFEDTGAITAAATTSLPEYPGSGRTWDYRYCWLRDAYFTLTAMRRLGHFEETEGFVTFLKNLAESTPGRLQPVYGISGERALDETVLEQLAGYRGEGPVRVGNAACAQRQHDVYGEMLAAISPLSLDLRFDGQAPAALVRLLLDRIAETMEQPDAGLWEQRDTPKVHTFSLLMHWLGAAYAARIAAAHGQAALEGRARGLVARARSLIEERCYRPALGYYADSTSTDHADAALLMMHNLGFLRQDHPYALSHLMALRERLDAGCGLLHRYRHHDGIGDTHAAFTVCGFWCAEALARMGRGDEAAAQLEQLVGHANHLGLFSEDVDPRTGEQWGNFPQTYSHVGLINAAFALRPVPDDLPE